MIEWIRSVFRQRAADVDLERAQRERAITAPRVEDAAAQATRTKDRILEDYRRFDGVLRRASGHRT